MSSSGRIAGTVLVSAALLLPQIFTGTATAAPPDHYEGADPPQTIVDCGRTLTKTSTYSGRFSVRPAPKGNGQAFLAHDVFRFVDTYTDTSSSESFTMEGHVSFKELRARQIDGDVYEFILQAAANVVVRDPSGRQVVHGAGRTTERIVFDTLGDSEPGGTLLEGPELVSAAGKHPFLELSFCDWVNGALGNPG